MADDSDMRAHEMKAHEASYDRMIGMLKWGTVATAIVTALVIWAIA